MASRGGADVGRRLMIKYGLPSSPSDILIERWRARTNQLIVAGAQREPQVERLLRAVDLLVDGRFEQARPEQQRRWIGSANQQLHFLSSRYLPTDPRFATSNTVELRLTRESLSVNGWPSSADALRRAGR